MKMRPFQKELGILKFFFLCRLDFVCCSFFPALPIVSAQYTRIIATES
jgi:hypothetical protein